MISKIIVFFFFFTLAYADTPPPGAVKVKDSAGNLIDGTTISGQHTLDVNVSNVTAIPVTGTITTSPNVNVHDGAGTAINSTSNALNSFITNASIAVSQFGTWSVGRTWTLSSGTDSVTAFQGTSPWVISGTVTANAGTNLNTSLLQLDTTGAKLNLAQGSTTSGQTGPLIQGAVTTAAPTYTTAQTSPLSLTTAGALRVDSSGSTIVGTVTVNQGTSPWVTNMTQVGGSAISLGQTTGAASLPVVEPADINPATQNITAQDVATTTTAQANGQNSMTGTPTAGSAASFAVATQETVGVQVTGTWTGTLVTEISRDGGTIWFTRGVKQSGAAYLASSFTQNFEGGMNAGAITNVRVRSTAAWTGTATVRIITSRNPESIIVSNPLMLRDSTTQSISNTIKAASTAAVATDTAIVVALSPNSPLPANTGAIGYLSGRPVLSTFTQSYASVNLTTGAFVTIISSTSANINEEDIFDNSGGIWYLAYAASCGALSNATNAIIIGPGGGGKDFFIPSGNCVGFEALGANITAGNVYMTFYK